MLAKAILSRNTAGSGSWRLALLVLIALGKSVLGQELEPRAYSPSPVGTTFVVVGFGRSTGGVTFDPTIPISNAHADLNYTALGLGQTFGLFGRQALVTIGLPYAWGTGSGQVGEASRTITRSGLADLKARLSWNIRGSPALSPKEFASLRKRTLIIGTSLSISAPTGQYDKAKLINLGTNRWALKPEIGFSYPLRKFYFDLYAGAWFFTGNTHFFPGQSVRTQEVLTSLQAHVSYSFRRSLWLAVDGTWYGGGATRVNNQPPSERQSNSRLGATLSLPLTKRQSMKLAYSSGVTARTGSDFRAVSISWQFVWFDRPINASPKPP